MTLPGTQVTIRDEAPSRLAAQDTATFFLVGLTEKGPLTPQPVRSLAEARNYFGGRVAYGYVYDALDVYFREGGGVAYVRRLVGPAAAKASVNLFDQSGSSAPGDVALIARAKNVGDWGNALNVAVEVSTTNFVLEVSHDTDGVLERSPLLATREDAVAWAASSAYVDIVLGASNEDPRAAAAASLAGGADDRASITDAHRETALNTFTKDLGPGQVAIPGATTDGIHLSLLQHAADRNRIALLDLVDSGSAATLAAAAATVRASENARFGAAFAPWAVIPGLALGTTRTVPYSALQAGLIARSEGLGNSPNVPAAGGNGVSRYATSLSQSEFSDSDRELLNEAGVNVAREFSGIGEIRTYGYRTLSSPLSEDNWVALGGARVVMAIAAACEEIAESYLFSQLDGRGLTLASFGGDLTGVCSTYYAAGALYGETSDEAFLVETGPEVNTPESIASGELHAQIALRTSPAAERVEISITKSRTADSL